MNPINRKRDLPKTYNVRDMGGYQSKDGRPTQWKRLLRADNLHRLTPESVRSLKADGVTTVIDLRFSTELEATPNPFAHEKGVAYHHIPLIESSDNASHEVLKNGPCESAWNIAILEGWTGNVARVLTTIADAPPGTVLFHCHAGKDRTGLIGLLVLAAMGVSDIDLVADYMESNKNLEPMFEEIRLKWGATPETRAQIDLRLYGQPEMVTGTLAFIRNHHGSVARYFKALGLTDDQMKALVHRLLQAP